MFKRNQSSLNNDRNAISSLRLWNIYERSSGNFARLSFKATLELPTPFTANGAFNLQEISKIPLLILTYLFGTQSSYATKIHTRARKIKKE